MFLFIAIVHSTGRERYIVGKNWQAIGWDGNKMISNALRVLSFSILLLALITFSINFTYDLKGFAENVTYVFSAIVVGSPVIVIPILFTMVSIDIFRIIKFKRANHFYWLVLDLAVPLITLFLTFSVLKDWIDRLGMV